MSQNKLHTINLQDAEMPHRAQPKAELLEVHRLGELLQWAVGLQQQGQHVLFMLKAVVTA